MLATPPPLLYGELASWFHLLTPPEDYGDEAAYYRDALVGATGRVDTLLELGAGGGNNASHLKSRFRCTLTDVSEAMLEQSRRINPECEHVAGDMRTLRLGRSFDAVLVRDAVRAIAPWAIAAAWRVPARRRSTEGYSRPICRRKPTWS